jgi:hypothetical protein
MSKRLYLSPVLPPDANDDSHRTVIDDLSGSIPLRSVNVMGDGATWALVRVATKDHRPLLTDPRLDVLPDFPMDARMNAMQTAARNRMEQALSRRGIDVGLVAGADGFRDLVRALGRKHDPQFHEDAFDVQDVT